MGAEGFVHIVTGYSVGECYDKLCDEAVYKRGHGPYSGTISECALGPTKKISNTWSKAVEKKAYKIIDADCYGQKWVVKVLDLGVTGYSIISVKKKPAANKKAAIFKQKYAVITYDTRRCEDRIVASFDKKTDADNKAKELILKEGKDYYVVKRPIIINNGTDIATQFTVSKRQVKSKPKKHPQTQ